MDERHMPPNSDTVAKPESWLFTLRHWRYNAPGPVQNPKLRRPDLSCVVSVRTTSIVLWEQTPWCRRVKTEIGKPPPEGLPVSTS
jgi:hypothetical protein